MYSTAKCEVPLRNASFEYSERDRKNRLKTKGVRNRTYTKSHYELEAQEREERLAPIINQLLRAWPIAR